MMARPHFKRGNQMSTKASGVTEVDIQTLASMKLSEDSLPLLGGLIAKAGFPLALTFRTDPKQTLCHDEVPITDDFHLDFDPFEEFDWDEFRKTAAALQRLGFVNLVEFVEG